MASAQARPLVTSSAQSITLPTRPGERVLLGSVSLGKQRRFTMFNIQAAGTITPDPDMNGAAFQLQFLICDQPDCSGEIRTDARILPDADASSPARVLATKSFGVSTHNVDPIDLSSYQPRSASGVLYMAVALKLLHSSGTVPFSGRLTLLRIDVMP
jgi:hypothetical protein